MKKEVKKADASAEEKIKEAARVVFHKKGFAATRTRDIAEEAGINLALLNYYFRSKEKLFGIIMAETLSGFLQNMVVIFNDEKTTLENKVQEIASRYIDQIIEEPEIPTFILTVLRNNAGDLFKKLPFEKVVTNSVFFKQHQKAVQEGKITEPHPIHFLLNLMGLVVFPFVAKPLLMEAKIIQTADFNQLMQERKKLIPIWIKALMKAK